MGESYRKDILYFGRQGKRNDRTVFTFVDTGLDRDGMVDLQTECDTFRSLLADLTRDGEEVLKGIVGHNEPPMVDRLKAFSTSMIAATSALEGEQE